MFKLVGSILEALLLRSVPGLMNLVGLTYVAGWLGAKDYGLYSTAVVTCGALSNFAFGPLSTSIVGSHAVFANRGEQRLYEEHVTSGLFLVGSCLLAIGGVLVALGVVDWTWVAPLICLGLYAGLQEIHHARVQFVRFGIAAITQAGLFLVLIWAYVRPAPSMATALHAFAASYAVAAIVSFALAGFPSLRRPSFSYLRAPLSIGVPMTLSTLAADSFIIGFRYLLLGFGALPLLGVFAFCNDIAQRLVGVVLNVATFALVPKAFVADAQGKKGEFKRTLFAGATLSCLVAGILVAGVLIAAHFGVAPALKSPVFDPIAFTILAAAVVVNRTSKMTLYPLAIRSGRTHLILASYFVAGPAALALGAVSLLLSGHYLTYGAYLAGFLLWATMCGFLLRRSGRSG